VTARRAWSACTSCWRARRWPSVTPRSGVTCSASLAGARSGRRCDSTRRSGAGARGADRLWVDGKREGKPLRRVRPPAPIGACSVTQRRPPTARLPPTKGSGAYNASPPPWTVLTALVGCGRWPGRCYGGAGLKSAGRGIAPGVWGWSTSLLSAALPVLRPHLQVCHAPHLNRPLPSPPLIGPPMPASDRS
jgi:hypothetical protein